MSDDSASAGGSSSSSEGGSGGGGGLLDQIIDAHEQVYNLVANALGSGGGSNGAGSSGGGTRPPPANDVPIFDGTAEEMLTADDIDMDEMKSPLEGMAEQVMGDIFERQVGPQTPMEHLEAFRSAINWTEPLIVGILAFQLFMFVTTVYAIRRGGTGIRFGLLVVIAILVRSAEMLNSYAGSRWEEIATQNYFDTNGVFVLIFVAAPLLLDCVIMLISFMREASRLLVEVKRMEVKQKSKDKRKGEKDSGKSKASGAKNKSD